MGPDGQGRLWILENGIETGPKKLYEILEPDPRTETSARLATTYVFEYPDANLNTETLFALGDRLVVVAKTNPNRVFQLPSSVSPTKMNRLSESGRLDVRSFVTAAGASADERLLAAVTTKDEVAGFENRGVTSELSAFAQHEPVFRTIMTKTQREAIDFFPYDSCDIVSVSEDGTVWRLSNQRSVTSTADPETSAEVSPGVPETSTDATATTEEAGRRAGADTSGGYWMVGVDGSVYAYGVADHHGATAPPTALAVDLEPTPTARGYWILDHAGRVYPHGDAHHFGDVAPAQVTADETATSLSRTPAGDGYWIFTSRGRVLPFGAANHLGDMTGVELNGPVRDSVTTCTGRGYYMVAADGGDLHLRGRRLQWLHGRHPAQPARHRHGRLRERLPHGGRGRWRLQFLGPALLRLPRRPASDPAHHRRRRGANVHRGLTNRDSARSQAILKLSEDAGR